MGKSKHEHACCHRFCASFGGLSRRVSWPRRPSRHDGRGRELAKRPEWWRTRSCFTCRGGTSASPLVHRLNHVFACSEEDRLTHLVAARLGQMVRSFVPKSHNCNLVPVLPANRKLRCPEVWQDHLQGGGRVVGAVRNPQRRSVQWTEPNQPRTDDGTALGCVVLRRPCTLGYWQAAASNSAKDVRRRIRRSGA
jgi:hypothetical protein